MGKALAEQLPVVLLRVHHMQGLHARLQWKLVHILGVLAQRSPMKELALVLLPGA